MSNCVVLSHRDEDWAFIKKLHLLSDFVLKRNLDIPKLRTALFNHPDTILFIDGDDIQNPDDLAETLLETIMPHRVFVITDRPLATYPNLFKFPVFKHHMHRRYGDPASIVYLRLMASTMAADPFDLEHYFPESALSIRKKITLTRSLQKNDAIEKVSSFFEKNGIEGRLLEMIEHAADELIMNGLFDAPTLPDGSKYRLSLSREADFDLTEKEQIVLQLASYETYAAISVTDRFGSFTKEAFLEVLKKNYKAQNYTPRETDPGAGLGLASILARGFSMLMICRKGLRTEVILFFPKMGSVREFRSGFRFVSINAD